jgi:hypothetical protein
VDACQLLFRTAPCLERRSLGRGGAAGHVASAAKFLDLCNQMAAARCSEQGATNRALSCGLSELNLPNALKTAM